VCLCVSDCVCFFMMTFSILFFSVLVLYKKRLTALVANEE
jgi:hypothetical protein